MWSAPACWLPCSPAGEPATWLDARSFLRAEGGALVKVDTALSSELLKARLVRASRPHRGDRLYRRRHGGALIAARTQRLRHSAACWQRWRTGVHHHLERRGRVCSADPRRVREARLLGA